MSPRDDKDERPDDDAPGFWMGWVHTVLNVRADSKGQIRRGGFVPGNLYKIIAVAHAPPGVQQVEIKGMGKKEEEVPEEDS